MKKSNFKKLLEFATFLNKFRNVTRGVLVNSEDRWENDVEHGYMLAMLADYIISLEKLSLDRHKVMKYALVHDIVEIYAGDTYAYSKDKNLVDSKKQREADAFDKILYEFPEHKNLWESYRGYEQKKDDEARFVYALDKIHPTINIYLEDGKTWHKKSVTFSDLLKYKGDKVKFSPIVEKYWNELRKILERNQHTLFGN